MKTSAPAEIVTACIPRDLPVLKLAVAGLQEHLGPKSIFIATNRSNFRQFQNELQGSVTLLDEDAMLPNMTLSELRQMNLPGFPAGAGWYFQQLLKLAYAFHGDPETDYLIWDADTVLLRPLDFYDREGRTLFTKAHEMHSPYFETYKHLLGEPPNREFSFISQHIVVNKPAMRDMLSVIESRFAGEARWPAKIMQNLRGAGTNCFSEYETYGHYFKSRHRNKAAFRDLSWSRDGTRIAGRNPSNQGLRALAADYDYVAFEASHSGLRRFVRSVRKWLIGSRQSP